MNKACLSLYRMCVLALIMLSLPVSAGQSGRWQVPILPDRGMYYTPEHGGTGINIDVDPNGYIFATFYTYDAEGKPTFYLLEGHFQPVADIIADDSLFHRNQIGSFDATLYTSSNGECLGTGCVYRSPDRSLTGHQAHMVWITQRHAMLTIDSQSWELWAGQYTSADTDKIPGTWTATLTRSDWPDRDQSSRVAILKIRKSGFPGSVFDSNAPDAYKVYDVACAGSGISDWDLESSCPDLYSELARGASGRTFLIVYDTRDGTMMLSPYQLVDGVPRFLDSRSGLIFQLELTPGVIRGREISIGDTGIFETRTGSLDMIRVPDGTFDASRAPSSAN